MRDAQQAKNAFQKDLTTQSRFRIHNLLKSRNEKHSQAINDMQEKLSKMNTSSQESVDAEIRKMEKVHELSMSSLKSMAKSVKSTPRSGSGERSSKRRSAGGEEEISSVSSSEESYTPQKFCRSPENVFETCTDVSILQDELKELNQMLAKQSQENRNLRSSLKVALEKEFNLYSQMSRLESDHRKTTINLTKTSMQTERLKNQLQKEKEEKTKPRFIYKTVYVNKNGNQGTSSPFSPTRKKMADSEELRRAKFELNVMKQRLKIATRPIVFEEEQGPTGFITVVFTDVESSTALWEYSMEAMVNSIMIHNDVVRRCIKRHGGFEVKTEGDAFLIAFNDVKDAFNCVLEIQKDLLDADWPEELLQHEKGKKVLDTETGQLLFRGLRVRIGLECGYPMEKMDPVTKRSDYFGPCLNRGARVSSVANGGEIIISNNVFEELKSEFLNGQPTEDGHAVVAESGFAQPCIMQEIGYAKLKGFDNEELLRSIYVKGTESRQFSFGPRDLKPSNKLLQDRRSSASTLEKRILEQPALPPKTMSSPNMRTQLTSEADYNKSYSEIQNEYLQKDVNEANAKIKALESEVSKLQHELAEIENLNPAVASYRRQKEVSVLQHEIDTLKSQNETMRVEAEVMRAQNKRLLADLDHAREQMKLAGNF